LAQDPDTQARAGPGQEPRVTSRVTSKSAQSPGPPTTSAAGHLFTHSHSSLNCLLPSSPQQCQCSSAAATLPAPAKSKMLPPGGAGVPPRAFPSVGLTIVVGLAILGGLWIPSALASTVVTSSPPTTVADSRTPGGEVHPPPGSTGSGARDRPVSPDYSLKALRCPASTARLYPVDTVCGVSREPQDEPFPSSQSIRRKAFLLQRDRRQEIDLWRCNKRTSSHSIHCGFQSWVSPEGFHDAVYEPTRVTPEECYPTTPVDRPYRRHPPSERGSQHLVLRLPGCLGLQGL
jgi:hypothetical protein